LHVFQFYGAWNVSRSEAEISALALKYNGRTSELENKLRLRYYGTGLDSKVEDILSAKGKEEEEQLTSQIFETEAQGVQSEQQMIRADQRLQRAAPALAETLESPRVHECTEQSGASVQERSNMSSTADDATRLVKQADVESKLRTFYALHNVDKSENEINTIVAGFWDKEQVLNSMLGAKYFGTDLTWAPERLVELLGSRSEAEEKAHDWQVAEQLAASREQTAVQDLLTLLTQFYVVLSVQNLV
jgi:hypothetical protein